MERQVAVHKKEDRWTVRNATASRDSDDVIDCSSREAALLTAGAAVAVVGGGSVRLEDENGDVRRFDIVPVPAD